MKERWVNDITGWADEELLVELDRLERALARGIAASRRTEPSGRIRLPVDEDLLALAGREHAVVEELRRRHQAASAARAA